MKIVGPDSADPDVWTKEDEELFPLLARVYEPRRFLALLGSPLLDPAADLYNGSNGHVWELMRKFRMRFRLLTYNIHKGIGGIDRRYRPERIVEAIAHCQPDLVLLQEVDDGVPRSSHHRQVDFLGDALAMPHRAYQANVRLKQGCYGNAILSRFPLFDLRDLELTVPLKKRRRALVAHCRLSVDGHDRTLVVFNFHLGLSGFERTIQLRRFLSSEVLKHSHHTTPVVAAGDFNDVWGTLGRRLLAPVGFQTAAKRIKTFPAFLPIRPLDRIFFRGDIELHHSFASRTGAALQASDHLPMVADFLLTNGKASAHAS